MQHCSHLLMIQPVNFGFNTQTAVNNSFQKNITGNLQRQALDEFNNFVAVLRANKVDVTVVADSPEPATPDAIFPNNWISFHEDGTVFLYPMFAANRRQERKAAVLQAINNKFIVNSTADLTEKETDELFLEGTGSMVLDRVNKIAYACLSARTHEKMLKTFCNMTGYRPVVFNATDGNSDAIYHTNVMMCVADKYAVVCLQSVTNLEERRALQTSLQNSGKTIIEITPLQLAGFAGNMLQVKNADAELVLVMSTRAFESLDNDQATMLQQYNRIVHAPLQTIETAGGGSARCMMAEVFLELR